MYAIVDNGNKQYKAEVGSVIRFEKLSANVGDKVEFDRVLLADADGAVKVGAPTVEGAKVVAKVAAQGKAKKITVFKYKPKKDYRKKTGHRQPYTKLVIEKNEA